MDLSNDLDMLRNLFGPITDEYRKRIQDYVNNPSFEEWNNCHGIFLQPNLTFWQAVRKVKPDFPATGRKVSFDGTVLEEWKEIPDQETALKAILYAAYIHKSPQMEIKQ